jgi:hypothetical protein
MENSRLLDVLPETPLDLRSRGIIENFQSSRCIIYEKPRVRLILRLSVF